MSEDAAAGAGSGHSDTERNGALAGSTSAARRAAWEALTAWLVKGPERARLGSKKRPFPPPALMPRERAFAKDLAEGSVARKKSLDAILSQISKGRKPRPEGLRAALLMSAWQLLFAHEIAAHSIVHEGVELAKAAAGVGGGKFANAILRRLAAMRELEDWLVPANPDQISELALWHSLPEQLIQNWIAEFGIDQALELFELTNERPLVALRLRAGLDQDRMLAELRERGFEAHAGPLPSSVLIDRSRGSLIDADLFQDGSFSFQDATQIEVAELVAELATKSAPGSTARVLDYCAAPGTKTCAIAARLGQQGEVFAYDENQARLAGLPAELQRLHLSNVQTIATQEELAQAQPFDVLLVDAPCSNSGVLARRKEARWRYSSEALTAHSKTQVAILQDALRFIAPGGKLVYSTCSIEARENEEVAQAVVKATADTCGLRLLSSERCLPERGLRDGGGVSVFSVEGAAPDSAQL